MRDNNSDNYRPFRTEIHYLFIINLFLQSRKYYVPIEGLTIAQGKEEEYSCITLSARFFEKIYVLGA